MPKISQRADNMPASPIRKLSPYAEAARNNNIKVLHLNIGQPDLPTPKKALDALKLVDRKTLEYSPSQGFLSLRKAFVGYYHRYGIELTTDQIICTCGGSEALLFAFLACFDPGDELIMIEPCYANYLGFAASAGIKIRTISSYIENSFALPSVEDFEKAINERTRAILICNPSNPSGCLYNKEELNRIRDIVKKHNIYLISDEVYREFVYIDEPYISALSLEGIEDNVIVIDSVSKRYSECGIRIGQFVSRNAELLDAVLRFAQSRLSPPLLGQIVAEASVEGTEEYSKECYHEYKKRRDFFIDALNKIEGVYSPMPQGAFYTIASLPVEDAEDFCKWCLTDFYYTPRNCKVPRYKGYTLMMAPAAGFYSNKELGKNQVRLAYVLSIEDLQRAVEILEEALKRYKSIKK